MAFSESTILLRIVVVVIIASSSSVAVVVAFPEEAGGGGGYDLSPPSEASGYSYGAPKPKGPLLLQEGSESGKSTSSGGGGGRGTDPSSSSSSKSIAARGSPGSLRVNIPRGGVPGRDYPILASVPNTGFSCGSQLFPGYFADTSRVARCQVFHICQFDGRQSSFLCPNGTIFNQQYFVCDWWFNVDCNATPLYLGLNLDIGKIPATSAAAATSTSSGGRPAIFTRPNSRGPFVGATAVSTAPQVAPGAGAGTSPSPLSATTKPLEEYKIPNFVTPSELYDTPTVTKPSGLYGLPNEI